MTLTELHEALAWFLVLSNAAVGVWALAAQRLEPLRRRALWWVIAVAQSSTFAIAIVGVLIVNRTGVESWARIFTRRIASSIAALPTVNRFG